MEPSEISGGKEECDSSESGWTMYIGSPLQGCDDDGSDGGNIEDDDGFAAKNGGFADETDAKHEAVDSDDSMASDASSGPSHQGRHFNGNMNGFLGTSHFKHDEDEDKGDCNFEKKAKKSKEKQKLGMKKKEDKEKEGTTPRSGSKLRIR